MKPNPKSRILLARLSFPLASAIAALLATTSVHAGQIWDGGSSANNNWNTASNWDGTTVNLDGTGVLASFTSTLSFGGNTQTSTNNDVAGASPTAISFTNDGSAGKTSAFTLAGNAITLGGNIATTANTAGSTITDIISLNMILNGTRTITTNIQSGTGVQHNLSISGNITEDVAGRGLTKGGSGILTLSGTNSYSGTTTVNSGGGTLKIDAASALPSGSLISLKKAGVSSGTLLMNTSGVNVYNNTFGNFTASNTTVTGGQANIRNAQGDNTFTGNMNVSVTGGNGVVLQSDAGTLRIAGNLTNTLSSYRLFEFAGAGSSVFSGQANDTSGSVGVALFKTGSGTLSITGTNSNFIGGIYLLQGVVNVASVANTGFNSSIGAGGAINLTGQGTSGTLQYTGSTAVTTNHALNVAATGGTLDASGTGSGTLKFTGTFTTTDPAAFNLTFTNGSNVATNAASNVPGTVGGNVMTATATGLAGGTTITSISGSSYTLSNPFTGTTGAVSTTFGIVARTLTLTGSNAGANEISSTLADSSGGGVLGINKNGEGAWTLSGPNTYTGATNVQGGKLLIDGSTASGSAVTVGASGTLGGTGTINGTLAVTGILAPGTGSGDIQTLDAGTTTWNGGSIWNFDLSSTNDTSDKLVITGNLVKGTGTLGTDYVFNFMGSQPVWNTTYTLATFAAFTDFTDGLNFTATNLGAGSYSTSFFTLNSGSLTFTAVPEPTSALAGLLLSAGLLRRRRK